MEENIELANTSYNLLIEGGDDNNEAIRLCYTNVRRHHRTTSLHRNVDNNVQTRTLPRDLEQRRNWLTYDRTHNNELEVHADQIVERMEQDKTLNQNDLISEQLRKEALRSMPQYLTVKRHVKDKLTRSINLKVRHRNISLYKRWKYMTSMNLSKVVVSIKNCINFFEVWYSTLKRIEGNFGSGISSYFKFFRWLFFLNFIVMLVNVIFIVVPQLILINNSNRTTPLIENNVKFSMEDIFTGEGYLTNTLLYYGYYSNESLIINDFFAYNIPYAYFLTMIVTYGFYLIVFGSQFASSYRKSFIETRSGLKNVFANKIFCAWDYSIATEEAATLKHSSLYHELREIISESDKKFNKVDFLTKVYTFFIRLTLNILIFLSIIGICYLIWYILSNEVSETTLTAIVINVILIIFPRVLKYVSKYEDYNRPRVALFMNLLRLFVLEMAIIIILIIFWTGSKKPENCWETFLGQEVYRLILFDFIFSVLFTLIFEVGRFLVHNYVWNKMECQVFDIAGHTIELVYNQTLFWVGSYFAPMLIAMIIIKLLLIWYVKSQSLLNCCKGTSNSWRASETNTLFLMLSLISLLASLSAIGYIIYNIDSSECGPLTNGIKGILPFNDDNIIWNIIMYAFKPGFIGIVIVALCAYTYYQSTKVKVQKRVVKMLREMLILEAKDKEFLLSRISKVTKGEWQYNLNEGRYDLYDPYKMMPSYNNFGQMNTNVGDDIKEKSL